jgi:hypothetical protein
MTISQVKAVEFAQAIYAPIAPGVFSQTWCIEGVHVGYALIDNCASFTFAGSEGAGDWLRDFRAVPFKHPQLGILHDGFWQGMDAVFATLKPLLIGDVAIQGHSLGCAHAAILAGLCAFAAIPVNQLCLFAPPRVSYSPLAEMIRGWVRNTYAYRNGMDPVPEVALTLPCEPWTPIATYIALDEMPGGIENILPLDYHKVALYRRGVKNLYPSA